MELANGCLEIFAALVILILLVSMRSAELTETFEERLRVVYDVERADFYEITIADNGVGFDINEPQVDPDTHIGIQNVRDRLWSMCGGTLSIKSEVGKGTEASIKIPKGEADA